MPQVVFGYYLLIVYGLVSVCSSSTVQEGLPFCDVSTSTGRYVLVSTLDGKLTALSPDNGGNVLWSVRPGEGPMLSSSIHRLEISSYGGMIRMIPSLSGGLYKFNGETVEAIPLTADHLLQSSFRFSDDLVMTGGKESQTIGVSLTTGEILYECTMRGGCREGSEPTPGDVLVVQRQGQTVRAVEPRSGNERWNFSVAQHDLKLMSECHRNVQNPSRLNMKIVIPEGLVCSVDTSTPSDTQWKHKFDSPVVSIWEIIDGQIFEVDLFSTPSQVGGELPELYIGMHEKQLYIQESVTMLNKREQLTGLYGQNLLTDEKSFPKLPWRPVSASSASVGLIVQEEEQTALEGVQTTAVSVLNESPAVEGHGFYLYSEEAIKHAEEGLCHETTSENSTEWLKEEEEESNTPVTVVIVSLWYWWREVSIISISTALLFNLVVTRGYLRFWGRSESISEHPPSKTDSGIVIEDRPNTSRASSESEFVSRYLSDFEPVRCLGKGGFGVVFEAKNKIDDCHYAVKRIALPDAASSRDRVLREVRALAKLDHQHIVRYFNSWLESPPAGWDRDLQLLPTCSGTIESPVSLALEDNSSSSESSILPKRPARDYEASDSFIVFCSPSHDHAVTIGSTETSEATNSEDLKPQSTEVSICAGSKSKTSAAEWCQGRGKVYLYIQMQLCQRKSLRDWLRENKARDNDQILQFFGQIVMAVEYVHHRNLIHRDLKPSNIFFSMDQQIKIGDFGLVATMEEDGGRGTSSNLGGGDGHTALVGTQLYMSPEQLAGKPYSYKVDIFSLGLILFELLVPFSTEMERLRVLQDVKKHSFPKEFILEHEDELHLLKEMLSHCPDERPTIFDLRARPPLKLNVSTDDVEKVFFDHTLTS